jgi:hypothetical protein
MLVIILVSIIVIISVFMYIKYIRSNEHYTGAVLTQLYAKDAQDTYLTGDAWKYIPNSLYPYTYRYPYNSPYGEYYGSMFNGIPYGASYGRDGVNGLYGVYNIPYNY